MEIHEGLVLPMLDTVQQLVELTEPDEEAWISMT
jgi:hypothetical protein